MTQGPWANLAMPLIPADHLSRRQQLRDFVDGVFRGRLHIDIGLGEREGGKR